MADGSDPPRRCPIPDLDVTERSADQVAVFAQRPPQLPRLKLRLRVTRGEHGSARGVAEHEERGDEGGSKSARDAEHRPPALFQGDEYWPDGENGPRLVAEREAEQDSREPWPLAHRRKHSADAECRAQELLGVAEIECAEGERIAGGQGDHDQSSASLRICTL